jgi:hypothetical protein
MVFHLSLQLSNINIYNQNHLTVNYVLVAHPCPSAQISNKQTRNVLNHGSQDINHTLERNIRIAISAPRDLSCTSIHSRSRTVYRYHTFFGTDYTLPVMEPIVHGYYRPFSFNCSKMYPVILSGLGIAVVNSKPSQCQVGKHPNLSFYMSVY